MWLLNASNSPPPRTVRIRALACDPEHTTCT